MSTLHHPVQIGDLRLNNRITPLDTGFGAVIEGLRLERPATGDAQLLQDALLEHGLLVIRDQQLMPWQHVAASALFGELESFHPAPGQIPGLPQVFRLASRSGEGYRDVGRYWHSDGSFRDDPTPISIWNNIETPEHGGATLFTDLRAAWHTLPEALRGQAAELVTLHRNGVRHPLMLAHPQTGEPSLYVNVGLTSGIEGMTDLQAGALVSQLDRHLARQGAVYRHEWRPGDVVVADNLRVAHKATPITDKFRRILDRTTIAAGTAFRAATPSAQFSSERLRA